MWFFERNYQYLGELFPGLIDLETGSQVCEDKLKKVTVQCLEVSRYTTLISLNLTFKCIAQIEPVHMTVRMYHDAEVADVISYQNISRLIAPIFSTEKDSVENHKRQANILLYEILLGCLKSRLPVSV